MTGFDWNYLPPFSSRKTIGIWVLSKDVTCTFFDGCPQSKVLNKHKGGASNEIRDGLPGLLNRIKMFCLNVDRLSCTFFLWVREFDSWEFRIWNLLFFHWDKWRQLEFFEGSFDEKMANTMQGGIYKFDRCSGVGSSGCLKSKSR